jgi:hypothetical protein
MQKEKRRLRRLLADGEQVVCHGDALKHRQTTVTAGNIVRAYVDNDKYQQARIELFRA